MERLEEQVPLDHQVLLEELELQDPPVWLDALVPQVQPALVAKQEQLG